MQKTLPFRPVTSVLVLAWPVVLEMALHTFVWIFDTAMVMRLGSREATAVEYGAIILYYTVMVVAALGVGANALVARYTGAGDPRKAAAVGGQALALGLVLTAALSAAFYFLGSPLIEAIMTDAATARLTKDYFYTTLQYGGTLMLPWIIINGIIRGTGNTRVPMLIALVANIYNVVGDYLLIFGHGGFPALGVRGAAIATGSAQLLGLCLALGYLFLNKKGLPINLRCLFPFRKEEARMVLGLSTPAGAEELVRNGSRILTATWITALGPVSFAANAAAVAAESFSFMPGYAFAIAATTLVGQRLGAGFPGQARIAGYWAAALGTALMTGFGLVFLFFPYAIMAIFNPPEPEVLRLGARCLQFAALEQPFIAISMIFGGALRGTGDTRGPFAIETVSNFLVRIPLIYAVVFIWHLDVTFVWLATALQYLVSGLLLARRYRKKDWLSLERLPSPAVSS